MATRGRKRHTPLQDSLCGKKKWEVCSFPYDYLKMGFGECGYLLDSFTKLQTGKDDTLEGNKEGDTQRMGGKDK